MAMMAKMRSLAPAFILTVGGLFVLFMVISDSNVLEALGGGRTNNIGVVNGENITYQEFQTALDQQIENQKRQTGKDLEEAQIDQIREQVWDAVVTQKLFAQLIKKYGITVPDQEIKDIILGNNPPDFLKQNFIDSLGNFNKQLYDQAIFDPQNKAALVQAEELVRQSRLTQKLQSMILASVTVGEDEVKRKFNEQNMKIEADYTLVDINLVKDADVKVTDEDLKAYYDKNINNYKVPPQRKLKFVMFSNVASAEDSQMVFNNLVNVKKTLASDTLGFTQLVGIYSEFPYSKDTVSVSTLTGEVVSAFKNASVGDVVGPFATPQGYSLFRYNGSVPTGEVYVKASHILINQFGSEEKNLEEANKLYNQLVAGANFSALAKEFSKDPGSAVKGGDLGYFGKGMMVKEFEDASFSGKVGEVQKPVKTNYGYHIIKVTDRSDRKYIVEKIINQVKQSASSRDRNFTAAGDFAFLAKKNDFESEAKLGNYNVQETPLFPEQSGSVPSIGANKRLVKFSFENSLNTVSDPFKVPSGYVVVKITEVDNEKFRPFEELKEQLKPAVIREKKFEKIKTIADNLYKKINGDLSKAYSIDTNFTVKQTGSFTPQGAIPNIGRDNSFLNTAMNSELNKVAEPVKGLRGYYLIKVTNRTPFDQALYSSQNTTLRSTMLQEKRSRFLNQWVTEIKETADIVDNRYMFFGQ
ncbi:MAG: peptidylprolyl isomerase [Ignavibacteriales bacterium]|nr:peptidylprolyl isomerase [Ignavibacteriales bacterium]